MKLKTSFFNGSVLWKDIIRFSPLWGGYLVLLLLQLNQETGQYRYTSYTLLVYAIVCAITVFGDLFNPCLSNALHAMPMRREGWFLTHSLACFLFFLVPSGIFFLIQGFVSSKEPLLLLAGFGASFVVFLTFLSIAFLCIMLAGSRIGAAAFYVVLNFFAPVAQWMFSNFYQPFLYGITGQSTNQLFSKLFPVQHFQSCLPGIRYVVDDYLCTYSGSVNLSMVPSYNYYGNWQYLLICAGISLAVFGLALLLYRMRNAEQTGEFAAFKWLGFCFPPVIGFMSGVALFYLLGHPTDAYLFLLLYIVIGFFIGRMLLEKKFNVFHPKKLLGLGILTLAFFCTIGLTWLDPLGITRYVPKLEQVERVEACDYAWDSQGHSLNWSEPEDIQAILDTHASLITERNEDQNDLRFRLRYHLKDGSTVERLYYMDPDGPGAAMLENHMSKFQFVTQAETVAELLKDCIYIDSVPSSSTEDIPWFYIESPDTPVDKEGFQTRTSSSGNTLTLRPYRTLEQATVVQDLMDAVYADCEAGTMAQDWPFLRGKTELVQLTISVIPLNNKDRSVTFDIFAECSNTYAYLKALFAELPNQP